MEDIKVGEYIRTELGDIGKVESVNMFNADLYRTDNGTYSKEEILKHSPNIIDLIEKNDYVNGYRIDNIIDGVLIHRAEGIDRSGFLTPIAQYREDIKSIVTHEQFASVMYEV